MKLDKENQHFCLHPHSKCVSTKTLNTLSATSMLSHTGLSLIDAARLSLELFEASGNLADWGTLRRIIQLGKAQLEKERHTVSFKEAVQFTLDMKKHRSIRTVQDIRQTLNKLMLHQPDLRNKSLRSMDTLYCYQILQKAYHHSPARFIKARANLSGLFNLAIKQGWCSDNPVKGVNLPHVKERVIHALSINQIDSLIKTAKKKKHATCLAPLALMLYAGVRPDEVKRVQWNDIDWEDKMLYLDAKQTKTGGGRHIPLSSPLIRLLRSKRSKGYICPPSWTRRWKSLRQDAGFDTWVPDILRHSYASYHAKMYQNLPSLQLAMGHRDCTLLLTRYINLRGISKIDARQFWQAPWLKA